MQPVYTAWVIILRKPLGEEYFEAKMRLGHEQISGKESVHKYILRET